MRASLIKPNGSHEKKTKLGGDLLESRRVSVGEGVDKSGGHGVKTTKIHYMYGTVK